MRVRERALQRVILARERRMKRVEVDLEHIQSARIVCRERLLSLDDVQRCLPFRAGLGQYQRAVVEIDCQQADLSRDARVAILPSKAAGDHQMEHKKELSFERNHHPFSEAL